MYIPQRLKSRRRTSGRFDPLPWYSVSELAYLFEMHIRTMKDWIDKKHLPGYRNFPRCGDHPLPKPDTTIPNRELAAWARDNFGARRVRHKVVMEFCKRNAPDFRYVLDKFTSVAWKPEQLWKNYTKKHANPESESAPKGPQTAPPPNPNQPRPVPRRPPRGSRFWMDASFKNIQ